MDTKNDYTELKSPAIAHVCRNVCRNILIFEILHLHIRFSIIEKQNQQKGMREEEREREQPSAGLVPKWVRQPRLGQIKARSQELHSSLPHEPQLLPPSMHINRKLGWE